MPQVPENALRQEMGTDSDKDCRSRPELPDLTASGMAHEIAVALLTGGSDRPYVFGLATSLMSKGAALDLIGSDELDFPEFRGKPGVNFLNLRGSNGRMSASREKLSRVSMYYAKLIRYAATAKPRIFHILWNNKFESFDRTLLMLYYRLLGKRIVLTAHNVNAGRRDSKDTRLNRLTLRIQYRLADHIFVHTEKMKLELIEEFGVQGARVTVIPFGINNAVPNTRLTAGEAKQRLGIREDERTILFFGRITPYKGLEYLIAAFRQILARRDDYRLDHRRQSRNDARNTGRQSGKISVRKCKRDESCSGRTSFQMTRRRFISRRQTFSCCLTGISTRAASCSWDTVSACRFSQPTWGLEG